MSIHTDAAVRVDGLQKTFGNGTDAVTAVEDVSFEVAPGEVVGLLGPNGAGKTTTVKSLLGLVIPDAGHVEIAGVDTAKRPRAAYGRVGAIMEGARNVYWRLTVRENLEFFAGVGGEPPAAVRERHDRLLSLLSLTEKADTTVNELSRGQKQKVSLASTLARDVDAVVMDEPTLGLDVEATRELRGELRRLAEAESLAVLLTSHDMDVIETACDRVVILDDGSVVADDAVESLLDAFRLREYRVTVDDLDAATRRSLRESFGAETMRAEDGWRVDARFADPEVFYDLLSALKDAGASLRGVRSVEPGLETVFLDTVGGGSDDDAGTTSPESDATAAEEVN